jgi:hypothetical protein
MQKTHAFYYGDLLDGLFTVQPYATLDALCGGDAKELDLGIRVLRDVGGRKNPLAAVPESELFRGCDQQPQSRYPGLASVISIAEKVKNNSSQWTKVALRFLERAPDPGCRAPTVCPSIHAVGRMQWLARRNPGIQLYPP